MYDIIVIGAGPAGLTSAIYAARAGAKVLVLEALSYGGQIINSHKIDNYPALSGVSGFEFSEKIYQQACELGADIKFEKVVDLKIRENERIVITEKNEYKTKSVIVAIGVKNKKLGLANEEELLGKNTINNINLMNIFHFLL